jgi:hypothetical protein
MPSRPSTPQPNGPAPWTPRDLWSLLRIPNFDETDLQHFLQSAGQALLEDRGRAAQMIETNHFRNWIVSSDSTKLLVHGDFDASVHVSPFSNLCATIMQAFRASRRWISLVFFCGRHLAPDEYQGGSAMIRTLVAQLLQQFPFFTIPPNPAIIIEQIEKHEIGQLCLLFRYLMRQLPPSMTIFCLIDGIHLYEREEYLHSMDSVILSLISLVEEHHHRRGAKFKLLLTSPQPTLEVRHAFDEESESLLHMSRLPIVEEETTLVRLQLQLGAASTAPPGS